VPSPGADRDDLTAREINALDICLDAQHRCGERQGKVAFDHGIKAGQLLIVAVRVDDSLLDQFVQLCLAELGHVGKRSGRFQRPWRLPRNAHVNGAS
jgi:tRNA threonylcarbamoyladenosine modification (KEOPS) complex Cgi121 subunit